MGIFDFFKKAFKDMKSDVKAQKEVDKANLQAVKLETKANFEENRGSRTYARAKADAKKTWDEAHMSPTERREMMQKERKEQIAQAQARQQKAQERLDNLNK